MANLLFEEIEDALDHPQRKRAAAAADDDEEDDLRPPPILKPRNGKGIHSTKRRRELEAQLGKDDWLRLYDAYAQTGIPQTLADLTTLTVEQVEHMLDIGIGRLSLPAIRKHATDHATIAISTTRAAGLVDLGNPALLSGPEVQQAITTRAVQEAGAAGRALDAAIKANEIFNTFVDQILIICKTPGGIGLPEQITLNNLETLQKALSSNTAALERAVKLSRLTRGETTENVGAQIGALLIDCTLEELMEAEQTGGIPKRILGRFSSDGSGGVRALPRSLQEQEQAGDPPPDVIDVLAAEPSSDGDGDDNR